jgi:cyclopropane fatty-acyl-phospholipid synthase-like methyltransferase
MPTPPADLMYRVAHVRDGRCFKVWGLKCYGDFQGFVRRHCDSRRTRRVLDWGCGCGRVTAHFLADPAGPEAFGCDVDGEAIDWCNAHLRAGRFATIPPYPPTSYPDASFDLVLAYSVFTHLTREVQNAWLVELQRLLTPGGVVVATVHGDSATSFTFPGRAREVLAGGIFDGVQDTSLGGIVPAGYYRGTYQAQAYTMREWARYFDILEYRVRGIGNFQDAVVMRRR